mmetsp:Transcript_8286/g.16830  ORF Transcript_8286/g.16830 Transcript_8286/m.16830 type:complete len:407 (-) Transcript_8286:652-1872(-)
MERFQCELKGDGSIFWLDATPERQIHLSGISLLEDEEEGTGLGGPSRRVVVMMCSPKEEGDEDGNGGEGKSVSSGSEKHREALQKNVNVWSGEQAVSESQPDEDPMTAPQEVPLCVLGVGGVFNATLKMLMNGAYGIFLLGDTRGVRVHCTGFYSFHRVSWYRLLPAELIADADSQKQDAGDEDLRNFLLNEKLEEDGDEGDGDFDIQSSEKEADEKNRQDLHVTADEIRKQSDLHMSDPKPTSESPIHIVVNKSTVSNDRILQSVSEDERLHPKKVHAEEPRRIRHRSGLEYEDVVVGDGPTPKAGHNIRVRYVGRLASGGQFDASGKQPFLFRLGVGEVIKGWDIGIASMREGGKRTLIIPAHLAYGKKGSPPVIPPNATLHFDVELMGPSNRGLKRKERRGVR